MNRTYCRAFGSVLSLSVLTTSNTQASACEANALAHYATAAVIEELKGVFTFSLCQLVLIFVNRSVQNLMSILSS